MNECVVVPAFNEASTIEELILNIRKFSNADIYVFDDCSSDLTVDICERLNVNVFSNNLNKGYDKNISDSLLYVKNLGYTRAVTIDADLELPPEAIPLFFEYLENYDLCVGTRNKFARYGEIIFSIYFKFRYNISDPLCGMKGYKLCYVDKDFMNFDSIGLSGLLSIIKKSNKFKLIPITVSLRKDESRFGTGFKTELKLIKSLWRVINESA